jgi:hypothetical protein
MHTVSEPELPPSGPSDSNAAATEPDERQALGDVEMKLRHHAR